MDIKQITSAIMFNSWSNAELNAVADAVKFARAQTARQVARTISKGTQVRFSGKGRSYQGEVVEIKIKNAIVNTQHGRYRVPMNMLEVV